MAKPPPSSQGPLGVQPRPAPGWPPTASPFGQALPEPPGWALLQVSIPTTLLHGAPEREPLELVPMVDGLVLGSCGHCLPGIGGGQVG